MKKLILAFIIGCPLHLVFNSCLHLASLSSGLCAQSSLSDYVWEDINGDGIRQPAEKGVGFVQVSIYECGSGRLISRAQTDVTGQFLFQNLIEGSQYYLLFDLSDLRGNYVFTEKGVGGDVQFQSHVDAFGKGDCIRLDSNTPIFYSAGIIGLSRIGNFIWEDRDGDGSQEIFEPGLEGFRVSLFNDTNNEIARTVSSASGFYSFDDLYPGLYRMSISPPPGSEYLITEANQNTNDNKDSDYIKVNGRIQTDWIDLKSGEFQSQWDAGFYQCIELGDFIWFDINKNGIQERSENGINGIRVTLKDVTGRTISVQHSRKDPFRASFDGYYSFCVRPGRYFLEYDVPQNFQGSPAFAARNGSIDSDVVLRNGIYRTNDLTLFSGDNFVDIDFGIGQR